MSATVKNTNWLSGYTIVGGARIAYESGQPVHSCANCGQGIINVMFANGADGDVTLGLDCAERVGLTTAELREHYAHKFAAERAEANRRRAAIEHANRVAEAHAAATGLPEAQLVAARYAEAQAEAARRGLTLTNSHGPYAWHGGDNAIGHDYPWEVIEVGHWMGTGSATPRMILDAAKAMEAFTPAPWRGVADPINDVWSVDALFDLDGNLLPARRVLGKFGPVWAINDEHGTRWVNTSKAQDPERARKANAKKGVYEGKVEAPVIRTRSNGWWADTDVAPLVIVDNGLPG